MATATVRTEIEIAAPPSRVWSVLTDFERWSEWNRVLLSLQLRGPLTEGTAARLVLGPYGLPRIPVRLVTVREHEELTWTGGIPGVMVGRHGFRLTPSEHGTRVEHFETFRGLLAGAIRLASSRVEHTYGKFNRRLRDRCEES